MLLPMSWLKQFLSTQLPTREIAEIMTCAGIEVDRIKAIGIYHPNVIAAEVAHIETIEHNEALGRKILVNLNHEKQQATVFTRAPNVNKIHIGSLIAVALPEAILIDSKSDTWNTWEFEPYTSQKIEFTAHAVNERELGIGDDFEKLLILPEVVGVGNPILERYTPRADWVADEVLELTILANISRCQSVMGCARELAALLNETWKMKPLLELPISKSNIKPWIEDPKVCSQLSLALIEGVRVMPSPKWMQRELQLAGVDPINNLVDAGNYVMIELGQPVHVYDADKLQSHALAIRLSGEGETLHVLGQTPEQKPLSLVPGHPLVVCENQPVTLAGVVGGTETSVTETTQNVLIESAYFDWEAIRKSQSAHKIITEGSVRWSRGAEPHLAITAQQRLFELLLETCPSLKLTAFGQTTPPEIRTNTIKLVVERVNHKLGSRFSAEEIIDLLTRIGCKNKLLEQGVYAIETPAYRTDLSAECDLLEEIMRLSGYDQLEGTMPIQPIAYHPRPRSLELREDIRDFLAKLALHEVMTYTMTHPNIEERLYLPFPHSMPEIDYVTLLNPSNEQRPVMRRELLPSVLQCVQSNLRFGQVCRLFEIGKVYLTEGYEHSILPSEVYQLVIVLAGSAESFSLYQPKPREIDFFDGTAIVASLLQHLHIKEPEYLAREQAPFQPGQCAEVRAQGRLLGYVGTVHPRVCEEFDIASEKVVAIKLNLEKLMQLATPHFTMTSLAKFPSIELDISILVSEEITANWLVALIKQHGGEWVQGVTIFDIYRSAEIGKNRKAVALRFELNAKTRTLTMDEANHARERILKALSNEVGATLR